MQVSKDPRGARHGLPGLATPVHRRPLAPHGIKDQLINSFDDVEDAHLMVRAGPEFGQHSGVKIRTVGDHDSRREPPGLEVAQEPLHMSLIVLVDQGEGHGQVRQRVGR